MLKPVRVTAPTEFPVSVNEVKQHIRVDVEDDDALIATYIDAATSYLDGYAGILRRCLISQTWEVSLACFADRKVRLPFPDVSAVTVNYFDADDADQVLSSAEYNLHEDARSAYVKFSSTLSFPETFDREDAVKLTLTAGYGGVSDVPALIRHAILIMVARNYEYRGDEDAAKAAGLDFVMTMIRPFQRNIL